MSILNGVVAMNLDSTSTGYEEPSTPSRDPTSSPAIHIQWQNSQSACAAMEELRVASSVPRRPPQPLTFGFELPASAGPSSSPSPSDPFLLPSRTRTRMRSVRSRAPGRVHNNQGQSHSQNDVLSIPVTDASKFLDMIGRASARVDENSRKRMKVAAARVRDSGSEFRAFDERVRQEAQSSTLKGKGRVRASTTVVVTRSMDEFSDHTNLRRNGRATDMPHSSLPIMQLKDPLSQSDRTARGTVMQKVDKDHDDGDVHMHTHTSDSAADALPGDDVSVVIEPSVSTATSTDPQNGTHHFLPRPMTTAITRHSQKKRLEPPSPTPTRSSPAPPTSLRVPLGPGPTVAPAAIESSNGGGPTVSKSPLSRGGASSTNPNSTSTSVTMTTTSIAPALPASQANGPRRALGMTRSVPPSSTPQPRYSAAVKKPFRPPLAKPAATTTTSPSKRARDRQGWDTKEASAADPDSSFDISFDFDHEALEAAMKKYD